MLSFRSIITRVAQAVGVASYGTTADNAADIPGDPNTLALVKQAVNDGRAAFYAESSRTTPSAEPALWHFLRPIHELTLSTTGTAANTIAGDPCRYQLPPHLAGPSTNAIVCRVPDGAAGGHEPLMTSMDRVRAAAAAAPSALGRPAMVGFAPMDATDELGGPRIEVRIYPRPDKAYVLELPMRRVWTPLVDLNEIEPSPYPHAVVAFAVYELVQNSNVPSAPDAAAADKTRGEWLARARAAEAAFSPRTTGVLVPPDFNPRPMRPFIGMTSVYATN